MAYPVAKSVPFAGAKPSLMFVAGALMLSVAVSGCTRSTGVSSGGLFGSSSSQPDPLPPQPTQQVQTTQLPAPTTPRTGPTPPPTTAAPAGEFKQPTEVQKIEAPEKVAKVEAAPESVQSSKPISRQALIGRWTVSSSGANCDIFLALTKWGSGFRAAQRQCGSTGISSVQSWNVQGNQVVLYGDNGQSVASLSRVGEERYAGTAGGRAITFSR